MDLLTIGIITGIAYIYGVYAAALLSVSRVTFTFFFVPNYLVEGMCHKLPGGDLIIASSWILSPVINPVIWILLFICNWLDSHNSD
ncbi:hypothetical protein IID19_04580 [Patescibacteria group bacterium]|nr:hypothetical protein [Patescibacteria group bacterium]